MPGLQKHVHFNNASSPASSLSSLPSSGGPITPPLHGFSSPYHLPSMTLADNAYVNPILAPNNPSFDFDLSLPPTSIRHYATISRSIWDQPATHPPAPSMVVVCDRLPWVLTILPSGSHIGYVTVGDFVHGLYNSLRQAVLNPEFSSLPLAGQEAVSNAYMNRCKYFFDSNQHEAELMKGVKRVDFLVGQSKFSGIKIGKGGRWSLMVRTQIGG